METKRNNLKFSEVIKQILDIYLFKMRDHNEFVLEAPTLDKLDETYQYLALTALMRDRNEIDRTDFITETKGFNDAPIFIMQVGLNSDSAAREKECKMALGEHIFNNALEYATPTINHELSEAFAFYLQDREAYLRDNY